MASTYQPSDDLDLSHFSFGRARGVMGVDFQSSGFVGREVRTSPVLLARDMDSGSSQGLDGSPRMQRSQDGPRHSTPSGESDKLHQFSDMILQLGSQIGGSIVAKLMSSGAIGNVSQISASSHNQATQPYSNARLQSSENTHVRATSLTLTCPVPQPAAVFLSSPSEPKATSPSLISEPTTGSPPLQQYQRPFPTPLPQSQLSPSQQQGGDAVLGEMMSMLRELLTTVRVGDGSRW